MENKKIAKMLGRSAISVERALEILRTEGFVIEIRGAGKWKKDLQWMLKIRGIGTYYRSSLREALMDALLEGVMDIE